MLLYILPASGGEYIEFCGELKNYRLTKKKGGCPWHRKTGESV